jgi:RNA polymerase sigma-70 factor (ECF subfamily)
MMPSDPESEDLVARARQGDQRAVQELLVRHRPRLRQMVAIHLDRRLTARVDPSDVVQDALLEAVARLPEYLGQPPMPFYPWLRRLAWEHLLKVHQQHLRAQKRNVALEKKPGLSLPEDSAYQLVDRLVASGTSPSGRLVREELRNRVRAALEDLPAPDREVLVLRYLEGLSTAETAAVLSLGISAVKMRHRRALGHLLSLLGSTE